MTMLSVGDHVDRFVVEAFLGEGGISRVYRVRHRQLGTVHALKMMALKNELLIQRLVREGRIQANLSHPSVVVVTDILEHDGFTGLLMEFLRGRSLDLVLGQSGAPPLAEAMALFRQVLAGVAAAHDAGILHRDLKPGNVLLEPQGDGVVAKVTDFGIAKVSRELDGAQTQQSDLMGTPGYMAPEQADDPTAVDARADIYSLGAVLYCLVTGRPPFMPGSLPTLLAAARAGRFPPVAEVAPHVPKPIAQVVERCLAPDPTDRYASCRALAEALYGDSGPTFDAEVAGARPEVLYVPGAISPEADPTGRGGADTRVPSSKTWPPAGEPPVADPSRLRGPGGKVLFIGTASFVVLVLGWLLFDAGSETGSLVPDPERTRAAIEAQPPAEAGAVDPGLAAPSAPAAPIGALDGDDRPAAAPPTGGPEPRTAAADAPASSEATAPAPPPEDPVEDKPGAGEPDLPSGPVSVSADDDAVADAVPSAPPESAAPPEAPSAQVDLRGAWTGKLGGRPLTLRITDSTGGMVSAEIVVLVGTTYRTFEVRGPASDGGIGLSLAEASGDGWRLDGRFAAGTIEGTILPSGRKRGQAFSVRRQ